MTDFHVATRYADGHRSGAPFEHYGQIRSDQAIRHAGDIIEFARAEVPHPG